MKIHLRKKKLKSGKTSLYIEYYKGHRTTAEGKIKHIRDFEYLELYLVTNPKTFNEKKKNKAQLQVQFNEGNVLQQQILEDFEKF